MNRLNYWINRAYIPLAVAAVMALVMVLPGAADELMFRPGVTLFPSGWRLLICHLAHFSWEHFAWDALVIVAAGTLLIECRGTDLVCKILLRSALAAGVAVKLCASELALYCGSSGIGTALVAALTVHFLLHGPKALKFASGAVLFGIVLKSGLELLVGRTLFVSGSGFEPVAAAHLAGALTGIAMAVDWKKIAPLWRRN